MNDVQADKSDYLGTKLARVLGGEAAALNTLLAKLRPYLHCLVREQLASAERYQDHGSDLVQETLVRVHRGLDPSRGTASPFLWEPLGSDGAVAERTDDVDLGACPRIRLSLTQVLASKEPTLIRLKTRTLFSDKDLWISDSNSRTGF